MPKGYSLEIISLSTLANFYVCGPSMFECVTNVTCITFIICMHFFSRVAFNVSREIGNQVVHLNIVIITVCDIGFITLWNNR